MWFPFIFFEAFFFLQRVSESSLLRRQGPLNRGASVEFLTSKVQSVQAENCITIFAWPLSCALEGRRWFSLPFPLHGTPPVQFSSPFTILFAWCCILPWVCHRRNSHVGWVWPGSHCPRGIFSCVAFQAYSKQLVVAKAITGWWFETCLIIFYTFFIFHIFPLYIYIYIYICIYGIILPIDELHHFSRWAHCTTNQIKHETQKPMKDVDFARKILVTGLRLQFLIRKDDDDPSRIKEFLVGALEHYYGYKMDIHIYILWITSFH